MREGTVMATYTGSKQLHTKEHESMRFVSPAGLNYGPLSDSPRSKTGGS